jgi:DNA-binding response OmpR family regulator
MEENFGQHPQGEEKDPPSPSQFQYLKERMTMAKILIIEDEIDIANLARIILEGEGYHVIYIIDFDNPVEEVEEINPDLILLDIRLPGIDGLEICQRLKKHGMLKKTPIIIFSASGSEATKKKAFEAGADDFLVKPFTIEGLTVKTRNLLKDSC